jgi:fermentation-respiration switch protein FrsA (DUF1100 family)
MWMFQEPTPEQRAAMERVKARSEDLMNRWKRLLAEELEPDQLEVLHAAFSHASNSSNPLAVANWYEGMVAAAIFVRDLRLDESTTTPLTFGLGEDVPELPGDVVLTDEDDDEGEDDLPPDPFA